MLCGELHRIEHAEHFIEVAPGGHRIGQHQFDLLVRTDHEHGADRGVGGSSSAVARVACFGGKHSVEFGDFQIEIANHRVCHRMPLSSLNVADPLAMILYWIDAEAHDFAVALFKLRLQSGQVAEFGGANGCKVLRVREKHAPGVAEPFVEADSPVGCCGFKVRCCIVNSHCHTTSPYCLSNRISESRQSPEVR